MRRAAHVDSSQAEIVKALRAAGMQVQSLASVGAGVPDLLVGWRGRNYLLECKTERCDGGRGRGLTAAEQQWHETWPGQVAVVSTPDEAVIAIVGPVAGRAVTHVFEGESAKAA